MSQGFFGLLSSFDHNLQSWREYKGRLAQWFIANDVSATSDPAGVKRRAILLSALSEPTYKLVADLALPKDLQVVPYEDILKLLDNHLIPQVCGFSERYKFYSAVQSDEETYPQWAARLRGLTANCGFLNVEEALRDRFVMGMLPGAEREKLFARDPNSLSLVEAVSLAEGVRCARVAAAAASVVTTIPRSDQLFKIADNNVTAHRVLCTVCGFKNHTSSQCKFANYKCKKCNVKGHLRRMCKKVNYVGNERVDDNGDDDVLSPLYSLLQKNIKWHWDSIHDNAFDTIKKLLVSDQVLAHFNIDAKIILTVDASPSGLGAVLSQVDPADGLERPISFASRTLNAAERRYSQIQKEATAIIFGVRRFHQYLYGRSIPFLLRTDHKPLITIFGPHRGIPEVSANRLQRYAMFLSGYNFRIEYVRSADNCADYLSRASLCDDRCGYEKSAEAAEFTEDRASYVNFVVDYSLPVTLSSLREEVRKDNKLLRSKRYAGTNKQCFMSGDQIMFKKYCTNNKFTWNKGVVLKRTGRTTYMIKDLTNLLCLKKHKNQLIPYRGTDCGSNAYYDSPVEMSDLSSQAVAPGSAERGASLPESQAQSDHTEDDSAQGTSPTTISESAEVTQRAVGSVQATTSSDERRSSNTMSLRPVPRINYKPFFNIK
ncbi:unnamed protein product [Arctia plantaginis]|uniref:CCHC-type domain-containing protein n=1 Tax=Arctia plantaginis TaxID=874455 RepID=A0A8S1BB93_ARCPL|nr:unnamed protein product [Arctia plantaginis]CAB3256116.1 unnamed protein product [Arctia plantaginis]